jgi:intracellular multiplication protein IcmL
MAHQPTQPKVRNEKEASKVVTHRFEFYRDQARKMIPLLAGSVALNFLLGGGFIYAISHRPPPVVVPTRPDGSIVPIIALDRPMVNRATLLEWVSRSVIAAYNYDFARYRQQFMEAADSFTPAGWNRYVQALNESNNLDAVINRKLTVTSTVRTAPVIIDERNAGGVYTWIIEVPLVVTYQSLSERTSENLLVRATVVRRQSLDSRDGSGLAIETLVAIRSSQ